MVSKEEYYQKIIGLSPNDEIVKIEQNKKYLHTSFIRIGNKVSTWTTHKHTMDKLLAIYIGSNNAFIQLNECGINDENMYIYHIFCEIDEKRNPIKLIENILLTKEQGFNEDSVFNDITSLHFKEQFYFNDIETSDDE